LHPNVQKLIALQKVDQEIASLRRDLDSLPQEEQRRRRRFEELDRTRTERKEAAARAEVEARTMEKAIKQSDDEIKKLTDRLNVVRNNAEYQATLFQIESVKKERDQTQERCLELLEQLEGLKASSEEAQKAVTEERKVFDAFQVEAQKVREQRGQAAAAIEGRRKALAEGIPQDLLAEYEGLFKVRSGIAVAPVERNICQGCYTAITTNDVARLLGGSSIVQCGSCQRILYVNR
jgi:predicted  nucleic acid-binding Zn-ribbon protein